MLTRYHITLGAPTSAGGKVVTASSFRSINGIQAALEGDKITCAACKAEGVIMLDGPRLSETYCGLQHALNDDLCLCGCTPPPRLIATQRLVCQNIDAAWHTSQTAVAAGMAAALNAAPRPADELDKAPIVLLDPETQEPFKYRRYRLQLADGALEGTTDQHGATRALTAQERASLLTWQIDSGTAS